MNTGVQQCKRRKNYWAISSHSCFLALCGVQTYLERSSHKSRAILKYILSMAAAIQNQKQKHFTTLSIFTLLMINTKPILACCQVVPEHITTHIQFNVAFESIISLFTLHPKYPTGLLYTEAVIHLIVGQQRVSFTYDRGKYPRLFTGNFDEDLSITQGIPICNLQYVKNKNNTSLEAFPLTKNLKPTCF